MDTTRWTMLGAISLSLVAVAIFWATLPGSGPPTLEAPAPPTTAKAPPPKAPSARVAPSPRPQARKAKKPSPRSKVAKGGKAARLEGKDVPDDVLRMIEEARAEKVANSAEKLDVYAEVAEWDAATTQAVKDLVQAAHDDVDTLLEGATAGEVPWTDVRGEVRRIRMEQARAVKEELGEEEFRRFAKAMGRSSRKRKARK